MRFYTLLTSFLLLCILGKPTFAQQHLFDAELITTDDGLASLMTTSVFKDKRGFIWIGTKYGLTRYDGRTFNLYTQEANGLQQNEGIARIEEDEEGNLWLFYYNISVLHYNTLIEAIDIFNPKTKKAVPFEVYFGKRAPFKVTEINAGLLPSYTYEDSLGIFVNDAPYYPELYFGAGALYATIEDLLKFDQALFNHKLLNKASTEKLLTIHPGLGYTAYGLWGSTGWGNFSEPFYYRTGAILGSNANWIHTMEKEKTIIVLSNTNATNLYELSEKLYLLSIGKEVDIPTSVDQNTTINSTTDEIKGTWQIDLRPTPNSEPYLLDFYITEVSGKEFKGEFYGSPFSNGMLNTDWDKIQFAFTTNDSSNTYYHSGYFSENKIYGISYSEGRKFISYWTGKKK